MSVAITGVPYDAASSSVIGKPSRSEGCTKAAALEYSSANVSPKT
jgi:hypothetical protein